MFAGSIGGGAEMSGPDIAIILQGKCLKYELVGSRVTCDPAPTDTDQDVLVLTNDELWAEHLGVGLAASGFEKGGSDCGNQADYMANPTPMSFQSFTLDDLNLIVTFDPEFYRRFMAATGVSKQLNLLDKQDRVTLFQAVLYGNSPMAAMAADCDLPPFPSVPQKEYVRAWWIKSETGRRGCVEALNEDEARLIGAATFGEPVDECDKLPYPAQPRLNIYQHPDHGVTPSFCHDPDRCKGSGCCPKNYSCTE